MKKCLIFSFFFPPSTAGGEICFFLLASCQHADRNQLVRRSTLDLNIDEAHGRPTRCPARPTNTDDGLEDIGWAPGLGGESLPAASYGILQKKLKIGLFFAIRDEWRSFVLCFVHTSDKLLLYHTPRQLPPHYTGLGVKTVTLG